MRYLIVALLLAATLGCLGKKAPAPEAPQLAGTSWMLLSIESMDDAQGVTRIEEPEHYTMFFGEDGRAAFRVDCNRAMGSWTAVPSGGEGGSLQFGNLASTRAMCPPSSHGDRVLRDLGHVRGYLFRNGRLYLSLFADGGIYEWGPAPR